MKTFIQIFLILSGVIFLLPACTNEDEFTNSSYQDQTYQLKSGITDSQMEEIIDSIDKYLGINVRSGPIDLTEEQAKEILQPLTDDGMQIRDDMLESAEELNLTQEEIAYLQSMKGDELAALSFTTMQLGHVELQQVTKDKFVDCLFQVIGLDELEDVKDVITGTNDLMKAKKAIKIAKALSKRFFGYIGMMITVIEFTDCINS